MENKNKKNFIKRICQSQQLLKSTIALMFALILLIGACYAWMITYTPTVPAQLGVIDNPYGYYIQFSVDGNPADNEVVTTPLIPGKACRITFEISNASAGTSFEVRIGHARGKLWITNEQGKQELVDDVNGEILEVFYIDTIDLSKGGNLAESRTIGSIMKDNNGVVGVFIPEETEVDSGIFVLDLYIYMSEIDPNGDINRFQDSQLAINGITINQR